MKRSGKRSGQAMLVAIVTIGGAILGATTLAGFLTLYRIRATTDSENSAKAIFAADAGLYWMLYNRLNSMTSPEPGVPTAGTLSNGATMYVACYDDTGAQLNDNQFPCNDASATTAFARGTSLNSLRALTLDLETATTTLP